MKIKMTVTFVAAFVLFATIMGCGSSKADGVVIDYESERILEDASESDLPEENVGELFVYVCGAVNSPGVYGFLEGARVCDAISAADGFTEEANTDYVNQAECLHDGDKVYIPALDENLPAPDIKSDGRININRADVNELQQISGIGESKAKAIISYREENGEFSSTEEITKVSGIGEGTYRRIKDTITIK